jgi:hypothetical protein
MVRLKKRTGYFVGPSRVPVCKDIAAPTNVAKGLGQAKHLTGLDLVGIRQLILVQVEDLHLVAGAAQLLLGNGAQGIFGFHRLGPARRRASYLDIRHDVLLPGRDGLDRVPDLVALRFGLNGSFK